MDEKEAVDGFPNESAGVSDYRGVHGEEGVTVPHVHMDAMAFGMGCCCLQVTFQVIRIIVVVCFFRWLLLGGRLFSIPSRAHSSFGVIDPSFAQVLTAAVHMCIYESGILLDFY